MLRYHITLEQARYIRNLNFEFPENIFSSFSFISQQLLILFFGFVQASALKL
jgi:hypothetical protein